MEALAPGHHHPPGLRGGRAREADVRGAARPAARHQCSQRREQLRRPGLHDGHRAAEHVGIRGQGPPVPRRLRGFDDRRGDLPLHGGAPRPAVAPLAHAFPRGALPRPRHLLPAARASRPRQPGPAYCRRRSDVHDHDALAAADLAERDVHDRGVLRRAVVDQPAAVRGCGRLCGARLGAHARLRTAAALAQLQPERPGGEPARGAGSPARERGVRRVPAPRGPDARAHPGPRRRAGRQRPAHRRGEPQPRLLHHGLQLPDPAHPHRHRGAAVHPRSERVRRDLPVRDGLLPPDRRVLAGRHAVPADLLLRGRARAAQRAQRGRRPAARVGLGNRDRRDRAPISPTTG